MENEANTPTPNKKLEMIQGQFPENCPPRPTSKSAVPRLWAAFPGPSF